MEKLAIIMPVYNEEASIGPVLDKWKAALDRLDIEYAIHPYNDGSSDDTGRIIGEKAERSRGTIVPHSKANSGHGPTILQGYREAAENGYDWVFQVDSDDEMGPDRFAELWENRGKYDFLVGTRDGRKQAFARELISFVSRLSVRLFYGKGIWDVNSPYRLMRVSAFRDIWNSIPEDTFAPNVIISGMAAQKKLRSFETNVPQKDRQTGEVSLKKWKLLKSAAKSFAQTIEFALSANPRMIFLFILLAVLSLSGKLLVSAMGHNFDYESYLIVAEIVRKGGNVYAETNRYNYASGWFNVLGALDYFFHSCFRYALIVFLSLADIGIAWFLWRLKKRIASLLFLLSPVALYISGYHNQFDNVAVFFAFASIYFLTGEKPLSHRNTWISALFMGLSLVMKHVFLFFPIWFLFRKIDLGKKAVLVFLPYAIFFLSFIPYAALKSSADSSQEQGLRDDVHFAKSLITSPDLYSFFLSKSGRTKIIFNLDAHAGKAHAAMRGIARNVFLYKSSNNRVLLRLLFPSEIERHIPPFLFFLSSIFFAGIFLRKQNILECFCFYTGVLFVFSPAIADQYLAIPLVLTALYYWPFGIIYNVVVGAGLLRFDGCIHDGLYHFAVLVLCCIFIQYLRNHVKDPEIPLRIGRRHR